MLGEFQVGCPAMACLGEIFLTAGSEGRKKRGTLGSVGLANEIIGHVSAWGKRWRLAAGLQRADM